MKISQWLRRLLVVSVLIVSAPVAASDEDQQNITLDPEIGQKISAEIVNTLVELRGSIHQNSTSYYEMKGYQYYYEHSLAYPNSFRLKENELVKITEVVVSEDFTKITVKYLSRNLGKGEVYFSGPVHAPFIDLATFEKGFRLCFKRESDQVEIIPVIGNITSSKYHVSTCNHLPPAEARREFVSESQANQFGMEPCLICFRRIPVIWGYRAEREMGRTMSRLYRTRYPISTDQGYYDRVKLIGDRVLDGWPIKTQGYSYEYIVVDDWDLNAVALPTGFVFLHRGMLEAVESELELEAVLAHEIAHVERRHSMRQLMRYLRDNTISDVVASVSQLVAVLLGGSQRDVLLVGEVAAELTLSILIDEGYPRSLEEEADALATMYLEKRYGRIGLDGWVAVLRKMVYDSNYSGGESQNLRPFQSHPFLRDRIKAASSSKMITFEKPIRIVARNRFGEMVIKLELIAQRNTARSLSGLYKLDNTQVLGNLTAYSGIEKPREFKEITITTSDGRKIRLDNKEDSLFGPYEDQGIFLRGDVEESLDQLELEGVYVNIPGTKYTWGFDKDKNISPAVSLKDARTRIAEDQYQNIRTIEALTRYTIEKPDWLLIKVGMRTDEAEELLGPPHSEIRSSNGGSRKFYSNDRFNGPYILSNSGNRVEKFLAPSNLMKWQRHHTEFLGEFIKKTEKDQLEQKKLRQNLAKEAISKRKRLTANWQLLEKGMSEADLVETFGTPVRKMRSGDGGFIWYYNSTEDHSVPGPEIHIMNGHVRGWSWSKDSEN